MAERVPHMSLEETVIQTLCAARDDALMLLVLPVVLVKNEAKLNTNTLLDRAGALNVLPELGVVLDLTAVLSGHEAFASLAERCPKNEGEPRYFPKEKGGKYGRQLADMRTPTVVASRGFRMDATEEDLRGFLRKHLGN
jgi:hypothetical protein